MAITTQHRKDVSTEHTPTMVYPRRYLMKKILALVVGVATAVALWTSPVLSFEGFLPGYSGFDPLLTPGGMAGSAALNIVQQNTQLWNQFFAQRMTHPAISAAFQLGAQRQAAMEAYLLRPMPGPFFPVSANPFRVPMPGGYGMCGVSICS